MSPVSLPGFPPETLTFVGRLLAELTIIYLAVTFLVELFRQSLRPERMRRLLKTRNPLGGMLAAAALGAVTPFCSCSTVPLAAAMMRVGITLPVMATFLVMSPLLNPATFAILTSLAGLTYGLIYVAASFAVALAVGGAMLLLKHPVAQAAVPLDAPTVPASWRQRVASSAKEAGSSYVKLLPAFLLAVAVGGLLHNQVASEWIRGTLSGTQWWMVPTAAVVGVPVYASTAVLLPLGTALYQGGVNLGVITAFLMGATGFSIPEAILLRKIVGGRLLAILGAAFTFAVVLVGYGVQTLT